MRVLRVINSACPTSGGPIEGIRQVYDPLRKRGVKCDLLTSDALGTATAGQLADEVYFLGPGFLHYGYNRALARWLKKHVAQYDLVVCHGLWQYHSLVVRTACVGQSVPYLVVCHGMLDPWFNVDKLKWLKKIIYWTLFERKVLNQASAVLFTTGIERERSRRAFPGYRAKDRVVRYGTEGPPSDSRMPHLQKESYILFLGRVHPKKGCDLLLSAYRELLPILEGVKLVIAGPADDEYGSALKAQYEDLVKVGLLEWVGMVVGEEKWSLIDNATLFCLPSHQENFGISVAEALACGTPVIVSDKVNIVDVIVRYGAGVKITDDVAGVVAGLSEWFGMSAASKLKMGRSAKECFDKEFHIDQACESFARVFAEVQVDKMLGEIH